MKHLLGLIYIAWFCGATLANAQPQTPSFTEVVTGLPGVFDGSAVWGDYDNDGDHDILLTGHTSLLTSIPISRIYRNDGDGIFVDISAALQGVGSGNGAWGDYDNDGDLDIVLAGGDQTPAAITKVYRNDGGGAFVDISASLVGVYNCSVAWGDYDNDGDLDILLAGSSNAGPVSKIYRNDGGGDFSDVSAALIGAEAACVAWGDYDNDGDLDVLIAGGNGTPSSKIYRNNGGGIFTDIAAPLIDVWGASGGWGDYDSDGDLDIVLTGWSSSPTSKVYRNDGGGTFTDISAALPGVYNGSATWGDCDNDGDLDVLLTGTMVGWPYRVASIYRNVGGGAFTDMGAGLFPVGVSSASWGDHDNDGDLDVLLTGDGGSSDFHTMFYRNFIPIPNTAPTAPTSLSALVANTSVLLTWDDAIDLRTSQNALTYNIRLGTGVNGTNIVSPMSDTSSGLRSLPALGNTNHNNTWTINGLTPGTYHWSVQAIDHGFAAGRFAEEQSFTVTVPLHHFGISAIASPHTVDVPFSVTLTAQDSNNNTVTEFNGTVDLSTTAGTVTPQISGVFAAGEWTGMVSVSGSGFNKTVTATRTGGTESGTSSSFDVRSDVFAEAASVTGGEFGVWGDIDGDADLDILVTGNNSTNVFRNQPGGFTNINAGMLGLYQSSAAWGDYDNDGDLDVLILGTQPAAGEPRRTKLYRNFGGAFSEVATNLPQLRMGTAAWGDFDNDGDLDLALGGNSSGTTRTCGVYRNDQGSFTDISAGIVGLRYPSIAWGDYDNDADLDLVITGEGAGDIPTTKLYRNSGGSFAEINSGLANAVGSTAAWGDYDADGDIDLLLTGGSSIGIIAKVYNNNGGVFTDIGAALTGLSGGTHSAAWGDYDNDGDLDIALTGYSLNATKIYRNDGGSFIDINAAIYGLGAGSVAWGDYDNDGDLDLLEVGTIGYLQPIVAKIYRNNTATANTVASVPLALVSNVIGSAVTFTWAASTDAETPSTGLNYNLRVGNSPGGVQVIPPMADGSTGSRGVPAIGSVNGNRSRVVNNLSPGTYYWSVQAIDNSFAGGPFADEQTFAVVGPLHHFAISPVSSPQTAGQQFGITITAQDVNNNTVTEFTGTVDLMTTAGIITPAVSDTFVNGQREIDITVTGAGPGKIITATKTGGTEAGTSNTFDVDPGGIHHFAFAAVSSSQTAGIPFEVTITALDSIGNLVNDFGGTVDLTTNAGVIVPAVSGVFVNGQRTEMVAVSQAGPDKQVAASLTGGSQAGVSNFFNVIHGALHHYALGPITSPQTAGVPFNITITAQDSMGNTVLYPDAVGLTTTAGTITPLASPPLLDGQTTFSVRVTLADTGRSITATKLSGTCSGRSNAFDVVGGSLHHFAFGPIGNPQTSGVAFDITLIAQDEYNNTARSFVESVALSTSAGPIIPVVSGVFSDGVRHETVRITGTGNNQTIEATRTGGTEAGMSNGFNLIQTTLVGVLVNPCFETGKTPWVFYTNGSATFTSDAPGCGTQRKAHVAVATQGTNVQLYESGIALQPSQLYRLSFRAYSSTGHDLSVSLGKHATPYTPYGLSDVVFNLTTVWQEFSIEFTTSGFTSPVTDGRLRFWFAPFDASGDHFYVDTVMLATVTTSLPPTITGQPSDQSIVVGLPASFSVTAAGSLPLIYQWKRNSLNIPGATASTYTIPAVTAVDSGAVFACVVSNLSGSTISTGALLRVISAPSNVIVNGGFEEGTAPWTFYTSGSGNITRVSPGAAGSPYSARISIVTPGTNVQLYQSGFPLEAHTTYRLTFSAYSSSGHDMAVYLHQQTSPFINYGITNWMVNLSTGWSDYSKVFTTTGFNGTVSDARLRFWFAPYDAAGDRFLIDNVVLEKSPVAREAVAGETPLQFALRQNYPNPFNPITVISYDLPAASQVSLRVFDLLGKEITTLVNEMQDAGFKSVEFDASNLASGVYLYRLQSGTFVDTKKLVVVK